MPVIGADNFHLLVAVAVVPIAPLLVGILALLWRKL